MTLATRSPRLMTVFSPMATKMRTFGLVGEHLAHSHSPQLFKQLFASEGIADAEYLSFELPDIGDLMEMIAEYPGLEGFNVTFPYKELVMSYLTEISPAAQWVGAVNTVKVIRQGNNLVLKGFNTDIEGFREAAAPLLGHRRRGLVLGTGGASKAVLLALAQLGVDASSVSRSPRAGMLGYAALTPEVMERAEIIVNATPLGTFPDTDSNPPLPYGLVASGCLCLDLVYNPSPTAFMLACAEQGAVVADGSDMLKRQALAAWHIWSDPA